VNSDATRHRHPASIPDAKAIHQQTLLPGGQLNGRGSGTSSGMPHRFHLPVVGSRYGVPTGASFSFLTIQDSAAAGGATFNTTDSVNVSNNSGWNFQ
jgi:hypothetical protein